MRIIAKSTLKKFWKKLANRDSEQSLRAWYDEAVNANWKSLNDVKKDFPNASIVGNGRVVFNIKGNKYRLIVKFEFKMNAIFVRFIGTHKTYNRIKASEA
jgi:mRNA interferase HigB